MDTFPAITVAADKLNRTLRGFAAPGDYGYDTPEGQFLLEMYRCVRDLLNAINATRADRAARAHVDEIAAERQRQIEVEGWTAQHDDQHDDGEMASAAACYAAGDRMRQVAVMREWPDASRYADAVPPPIAWVKAPELWPWDGRWWKPTDRRRDLIKAGALIIAEIERLDRHALARAKGEAQ